MPDQASSYAGDIDFVFYFIYWSSAIACILIVAAMVVMVIRYRRRPGHKEQATAAHSTTLELTWTLIPSVVFMMIFYWGFKGFLDIATPPDNSYEIHVTGMKWSWAFTYPNGAVSNELHIPANRPVKLVLQSSDVIHSIFVPAFRMKKDLVPGRYNFTWVEATEPGTYDLYCAEYCGTSHSEMITKAVVHEPGAFVAWVTEAANWLPSTPPVEAGKRLWREKGCNQCHSLDGTASTGPTFQNLFGQKDHKLRDKTITVDENYIRESILNPGKEIVQGYQNVMPTSIKVSDQEITAIIEFMKSISEHAPKPMEAWPEAEAATTDAPADNQ